MAVPKLRFKEFSGEWTEQSLSDICEIVGGGTPDTTELSYWDGGIQWFTPTEIGNEKFVSKSKRTISELGLKHSSAKLLPTGTILLTSRATLGEMSITENEVCTNQGFQSLITNTDNSLEFVYYYQPRIKEYCLTKSSGSTFLEISKTILGKCKLYSPSLNEQEKISNFISTLDRKITLQRQRIKLLNDYKKEG
jgi:type I restriction enzyme S subunit